MATDLVNATVASIIANNVTTILNATLEVANTSSLEVTTPVIADPALSGQI